MPAITSATGLEQLAALPPQPVLITYDMLHPQLPFFRQPWVQKTLPLATSIILHLSVIIIGVTFFRVVPRIVQAVKEQIIVPDSTIVNDAPVGGVQNPGLGADPNRSAAQDKVDSADSTGLADKKSETLSQSLAGGGADNSTDTVIGLGSHAALGSGNGVSTAIGSGAASGDGGNLSPFGVPGGGSGQGPRSPFMGISGNAHTIAYVCDASGSMLAKMAQLKEQLRAAIAKLQPVQSFSVIFFADPATKPNALSPKLIVANPDNKVKFEKYLEDVRAAGSTDPIPGLELAFSMKPQLLYLLTDGDFEDNKKVLDRINQLQANMSPKVKINTIVFTDPTKADKGIVELMTKIAEDSGGQHRIVSPDDL
ncbi:MAG: hypothetical protein JO353_09700 [Phycisphaerae bacterium]|nr:hypothetical protein [Phycisphaerae bacterium]